MVLPSSVGFRIGANPACGKPLNARPARIQFPKRDYRDDRLSDSYVTQEQEAGFAKRVVSNLKELTGVRDAAGTSLLPLYNFKRQFSPTQIVGQPSDPHHEPESEVTRVTPEFFRSMHNEAAARRFWPNQNPLGRQVRFEWIGSAVREVIGVVGDTKQTSLATPAEPEIYLPFYGIASPYLTFIVRTNANPAAFAKVWMALCQYTTSRP